MTYYFKNVTLKQQAESEYAKEKNILSSIKDFNKIVNTFSLRHLYLSHTLHLHSLVLYLKINMGCECSTAIKNFPAM